MTISTIIIAKNEAKYIQKCLSGFSWTDEIIVIDNGSSDETIAVAKKEKVKILEIQDRDFSAVRNFGAKAAKSDWLLYIDVDEEIPDPLKKEILERIRSFDPLKDPHAYVIERQNFYLGSPWPYHDGMIRLIYKPSLSGWSGELHETAQIDGSVGVLDHRMIHHTHRTLEEMVAKTNEWSGIEASLRFKLHHPKIVPWRFCRVMMTAFFNSYITQGGWKVGTVGLIESVYQAFSMFLTYAKLWEMQSKK